MNSINSFLYEADIEMHLRAAYRECWQRLINAVEQLEPSVLEQLSNPFLVKALPSYRKAKRKDAEVISSYIA